MASNNEFKPRTRMDSVERYYIEAEMACMVSAAELEFWNNYIGNLPSEVERTPTLLRVVNEKISHAGREKSWKADSWGRCKRDRADNHKHTFAASLAEIRKKNKDEIH